MSPLSFTDEELDAVMALASGLPPLSRDTFLEMVASKLSAYPPGLVHRLAAETQGTFVKIAVGVGPTSRLPARTGKYGRLNCLRGERR